MQSNPFWGLLLCSPEDGSSNMYRNSEQVCTQRGETRKFPLRIPMLQFCFRNFVPERIQRSDQIITFGELCKRIGKETKYAQGPARKPNGFYISANFAKTGFPAGPPKSGD
jgi:hypothetical protein